MSTVARIVVTGCKCGFKRELCFFAREHWQAPCPDCGKTLQCGQLSTDKTYGNRRFTLAGGESMAQGFHPGEVSRAKRMMPQTGECIQPDGRVVFPDSKTEQKFRRELDKAKASIGVPVNPSIDDPMPDRHKDPAHVARLRELGVNVR